MSTDEREEPGYFLCCKGTDWPGLALCALDGIWTHHYVKRNWHPCTAPGKAKVKLENKNAKAGHVIGLSVCVCLCRAHWRKAHLFNSLPLQCQAFCAGKQKPMKVQQQRKQPERWRTDSFLTFGGEMWFPTWRSVSAIWRWGRAGNCVSMLLSIMQGCMLSLIVISRAHLDEMSTCVCCQCQTKTQLWC